MAGNGGCAADREGDKQTPAPAGTDKGRDEGENGCKLPEPEVCQNVVRRYTRQVQRPSRFKDFMSLRN